DPASGSIVARAPAGARPDYVRYVEATREIWVTEPGASRIEIFKLGEGTPPTLSSTDWISVDNGPESLVIDQGRGKAFTHRWQKSTVAIDVGTRSIVAEWPNGCAASRGIAIDESLGFLFAGCLEGTAVVLDAMHDGQQLSETARGSGFDVIGYSPTL